MSMINFFMKSVNSKPITGDDVIGDPLFNYTDGLSSFDSSIDSVTNIAFRYTYDNGLYNLPLLIMGTGWGQDIDNYNQYIREKFASYKYFVAVVGVRGKNGANGSEDAFGRECYDSYDLIQHCVATFGTLINQNRIFYCGYSRGGGLGLALGSKFPDLFNVIVDHFGMSNMGNTVDGWYETNSVYSSSISAKIGGSPAVLPNEYRSRNAREGIANVLGYIYLFHDQEDGAVNVIHSQYIDSALSSNYIYYESGSGDSERFTHTTPQEGLSVESSEKYWKNKIFSESPKIVPTSGTLKVIGFCVTKRFSIWLGNGTASLDGTNRTASVVYDVNNDSYTVTPILESGATNVEVKITQGAKTATQTISTTTEIIVS